MTTSPNPEFELEVFRAGDYGGRGAYSEEDLDRIAEDYNPSEHEAPVTVDHHQEGPALGWVRSLRRAGNTLIARLGGMASEFLAQIRSGAFKKRSIELYRNAPWSGRPYLRALSFLGACPPVVKGLADPVFAEGGKGERSGMEPGGSGADGAAWIAFDDGTLADLHGEHPEATAEVRCSGLQPANPTPSFVASLDSGRHCSPAFEAAPPAPAEEAALAPPTEPASEDNSDPASPVSGFTEPAGQDDLELLRFRDALRAQGRLLPAWETRGIIRFLQSLDDSAPRHFSETADAVPQTQSAWFCEFLKSLSPTVPMGEAAPSDGKAAGSLAGTYSCIQSRSDRVDPESFSLHQNALRFLDANPSASYSEALRAVASR